MTKQETEHTIKLLETLVERVEQHHDLLPEHTELLGRMMTLIEQHVARIERLEYHVLKIQPLPAMKTARHDH